MAINFTEVNEELFFIISTVINISIFVVFALPALIMCLLCVVALFIADRSINWPMRVTIINLFAAEVCTWLSLTLLLLGFPARERLRVNSNISSCNFVISLFIFTAMQRYSATTLYAIMVYIFLKHGVKKMKWYVIIPYIAISSIINLTVALGPFFDKFLMVSGDGACDSSSAAPLFGLLAGSVFGVAAICCITIVVFSVLTYRYMKTHTLEDNAEVKRAVAKNLVYLLIAVFSSLLSDIAPISYPIIRSMLGDNHLVELILLYYICRVLLKLVSLITPIATIAILKPVRLAMKQLFQKTVCCCCSWQSGPSE